ncbi:MAG: transporter [Bryobacteraceae bacterium]
MRHALIVSLVVVIGSRLDRQRTKQWDAFVEYVGDFPEEGGPRHLLHIGTAYKTGPYQQLDFHVGVGLSADAADHFVGVGYSFRLQALRH